jgi:D-beta-D-heptose 7-phosphate kinase / D-beta-D-heptose 1-phosphate adenosyltransferase
MTSFESVISHFHLKRVLVAGDIMLDRFVYGTVSRISPEAPAPVINTAAPEEVIGGAGNVARNISALGGGCDIVTVVGNDDAARCIHGHLARYPGITPVLVEAAGRVTTVKTRFVAYLHNTHMLRADAEETTPVGTEIEDLIITAVASRLAGVDAVVLSDYGKGVLTHRVLSGIISMAQRARKPVIVDPKGVDYSRYCGATVLTPNVAELSQALGRPVKNDEEALNAAAASLGEAIGCECMLVTRGERGMLIVSRNGENASFEATAKRVVDVSGAGDTVVASFALAFVSGAGFQNSARLANVAAGIAVSKKGTSQVSANELRDVLLFRPHFALQEKIFRMEAIEGQIAAWRQNGYSIGFTNGCFDLLHPGHVQMLCEARSYCDKLVVGLNSDSSVKRLKGASRPIQSETARMIVLAGLAFVDAVVLFSDNTPLELIKCLKPDVLIKGADYSVDQVVGRDFVESYGGKVALIELVPNSSTTRIIDRLKTGTPVPDVAAAK